MAGPRFPGAEGSSKVRLTTTSVKVIPGLKGNCACSRRAPERTGRRYQQAAKTGTATECGNRQHQPGFAHARPASQNRGNRKTGPQRQREDEYLGTRRPHVSGATSPHPALAPNLSLRAKSPRRAVTLFAAVRFCEGLLQSGLVFPRPGNLGERREWNWQPLQLASSRRLRSQLA